MAFRDDGREVFANRNEPLPVLRLPLDDDARSESSETPSEYLNEASRTTGSPKNKQHQIKNFWNGVSARAATRNAMYDRLFANIMSQVLPAEQLAESESHSQQKKDGDPSQLIEKPGFNLARMGTNFQNFNARIGVVFVLQDSIVSLLSWRHPTATFSFLTVYSLLSLNPHLLPVLPLACLLFFVMVPAFIARHPRSKNDPRIEHSFRGPPTGPPKNVKPAPELSNDFLRNMRDLQNSMEDFTVLHDAIAETLANKINFSDEKLSSAIFASLTITSFFMILAGQFVPFRFVMLISGWFVISSGHPRVQEVLLTSQSVKDVKRHASHLSVYLRKVIEAEVILDSPPETRQVEIYELQRHHAASNTWEAWLFSPTPYDPLSPIRISGARAEGTQFFEEVQAPNGWVWKDKKWTLDLFPREWVEQRMITGVEIEISGERWVYDIPIDETELANTGSSSAVANRNKSIPKSGWEEGTGTEQRGEWRRRRWVRAVRRKVDSDFAKKEST